jgi:hypothetical protein
MFKHGMRNLNGTLRQGLSGMGTNLSPRLRTAAGCTGDLLGLRQEDWSCHAASLTTALFRARGCLSSGGRWGKGWDSWKGAFPISNISKNLWLNIFWCLYSHTIGWFTVEMNIWRISWAISSTWKDIDPFDRNFVGYWLPASWILLLRAMRKRMAKPSIVDVIWCNIIYLAQNNIFHKETLRF